MHKMSTSLHNETSTNSTTDASQTLRFSHQVLGSNSFLCEMTS